MGTRSTLNWSDTIIDGITFGNPAGGPDAETPGPYEWDGGVPSGVLDDVGMFQPDGTDDNGDPLPEEDLELVYDVKYRKPKDKDPGDDDEVFYKDDVVEAADGILYTCQKQSTTVPPGDNGDWKIVKAKKEKQT